MHACACAYMRMCVYLYVCMCVCVFVCAWRVKVCTVFSLNYSHSRTVFKIKDAPRTVLIGRPTRTSRATSVHYEVIICLQTHLQQMFILPFKQRALRLTANNNGGLFLSFLLCGVHLPLLQM